MLVLSRKCDEKILLKTKEQEIELTIVRIDNNKVRLGIEADNQVKIIRQELETKSTKQLAN